MPGPKGLKIELTDAERRYLEKTVRKQTATQRQVQHAKIVLTAAAGLPNADIARLSVNPPQDGAVYCLDERSGKILDSYYRRGPAVQIRCLSA